eukprot:CAMPEP_0117612282 /NCGR_PEP_ID=MMETSP0784-20121206/82871_1 /TAXON_ID=39447 /ORGANISM="" /LENGTH=60 /DNA_ID=CAMNT_0005415837 /DNA_START=21 /DNA_END=200 /DNA_ORIENTATION=+
MTSEANTQTPSVQSCHRGAVPGEAPDRMAWYADVQVHRHCMAEPCGHQHGNPPPKAATST